MYKLRALTKFSIPLASHLSPAELEIVIYPGLLFKLSPAISQQGKESFWSNNKASMVLKETVGKHNKVLSWKIS